MSHSRSPVRANTPPLLAWRDFTVKKGNSMHSGDNSRLEDFSHWPSMRSADQAKNAMPIACNAERPLSDAASERPHAESESRSKHWLRASNLPAGPEAPRYIMCLTRFSVCQKYSNGCPTQACLNARGSTRLFRIGLTPASGNCKRVVCRRAAPTVNASSP